MTNIHIPSYWMEYGWYDMSDGQRGSAPRSADTEKLTINLGFVDLGQIELLVQEGFYSNRTDFIRTAIRNQLDRHDDAVKQSVARHKLELGLRRYTRQDLEAARARGEVLHIQVLGLAIIAEDVSADLARVTIASIHVLGALQASQAIRTALTGRIH
jgi:Arc/MetJ-type ribon-helix-helix transcriptional regulator